MLFRASGIAVLGMLVGAALTWLPLQTFAGEPDAEQQEFVAFLEYLGSWDGNEEDWVQFLDAGNVDSLRAVDRASAATGREPASSAQSRTQNSDFQLATTGN